MTTLENCWQCSICNKKYIRKNAFDKHILLCKFEHEKSNFDKAYKAPNISNEKLYLLLVDLNNKYDKLEKDYDELKKYVIMKKKKIDILEYLNNNFIDDYSDDFYDFIKYITDSAMNVGYYQNKSKISEESDRDFSNVYLNYIFELNFINGIVKILTEIIYNEREKKNIPIKVFNQKDAIYILITDESCFKKWVLMDNVQFKEFIIKIHKKIINLFSIWQKSVEYKIKDEHFNNIYLDNMKKMLGQSRTGCGSHGDTYLTIKNKLQKNICENFKNMISFEIE